jgi:MFS transporter, DHA1 family, tetracycline resistance protein
VGVLIGAQLADAIGMGLLLPVLPFLAQELGATAVEVTQIVAVFALMSVLASPLLGRLSDRWGRKPVVIASCLLMCVSYAGLLAAKSLAAVVAWRAVGGIAAAKAGVCNALILDVVEPAERGRYLGWIGAVAGVGMLLGPLCGALLVLLPLAPLTPYQVVIGAGGAMVGLALVAVLWLPALPGSDPSTTRVARSTAPSALRPVRALLGLQLGLFSGFAAIFSTTAIFVERRFGWGMTEAGLAIGLMTGTIALVRAALAHRILARLGHEAALRWSMLAFGVLLLATGASTRPVPFLTAYCAAAASYAVAALAITVAVAERTAPDARGAVMGYLGSAGSAAIVIGAFLFGYLFREVGPGAPFATGGAVGLAALGIYVIASRARTIPPPTPLATGVERG